MSKQNQDNGFISAAERLANGNSDGVHFLKQAWWALRPVAWREQLPERQPEVPDHWKQETMEYNHGGESHKATVYSVASASPAAIFGYISGYKGNPINSDEMRVIEDLRSAGFGVEAMALEHPKNGLGTLESSQERVRRFILDEDSPLYTRYPRNIPRIVSDHSTAGLLSIASIYQHALAKKTFPENLHGFLRTGTFVDTAGSAQGHDRLGHWVYTHHAKKHKHEYAGNPIADRFLYVARGIGDRLRYANEEVVPTHGQILEIKEKGQDLLNLLRRLKEEGQVISFPFTQKFVFSTSDSFASLDADLELCDLMGIKKNNIMLVDADHNPWMNKRVRNRIIGTLRPELQTTQYTNKEEDWEPKTA